MQNKTTTFADHLPPGLPSPIKDWTVAELEQFFGRKLKDIERAWMDLAPRGMRPNSMDHPERHRRLIGMLCIPGIRKATGGCKDGSLSWINGAVTRAWEVFSGSGHAVEPLQDATACPQGWREAFAWAFLDDAKPKTLGLRAVLAILASAWDRLPGLGQLERTPRSYILAVLVASNDILGTGLIVAQAAREFPDVRAAFDAIDGFGVWLGAYQPPSVGVLAIEFAIGHIADHEVGPMERAIKGEDWPIGETWGRLQSLGAFARVIAAFAEPHVRNRWKDAVQRQTIAPIEALLEDGQKDGLHPRIRDLLQESLSMAKQVLDRIGREAGINGQSIVSIQASIDWVAQAIEVCSKSQADLKTKRKRVQLLAQDPIGKANALKAAIEAMQAFDPGVEMDGLRKNAPPRQDIQPPVPPSENHDQPASRVDAGMANEDARLADAIAALQVERQRNQRAGEHITALQANIKALEARLATPSVATKDSILASVQDPLTPEIALAIAVASRPLLRALPSARDSARKSPTFRYGRKLLELLLDLGDGYANALHNGQPDAAARSMLGSSYRAKESDPTMARKEYRGQRTFDVDGVPVVMQAHLAIGVADSAAETLRVHFAWMNGRIVIGHCGEHLSLATFA